MKSKFGTVLRQAREDSGLTQAELADKADVSRVYVGLIERGTKTPTLDVFVRLAKGLKMAPSKLMERYEKTL
jgi:transcriptional regulator with XRE-family HTH domain